MASLKDLLLKHYCDTIDNVDCPLLGIKAPLDYMGSASAMRWLKLITHLPWSMVMRAGNLAADSIGGGVLEIHRGKGTAEVILEIFAEKHVVWVIRGRIRRNVFVVDSAGPRFCDLDRKGLP
jgi:hypothetical protein